MHEIAQRAAEAAAVPRFEDLADRGRRRRTRRHGFVAGAAAGVAVATIVGATHLLVGDGSGHGPEPAPAPSTTLTDAPVGIDPSAVVDGPGARVVDVALAESGPGAAVVWEDHDRAALALSDDQFRTRTDLQVPVGTTVEPAPDGSFVVVGGGGRPRVWTARGDGSWEEVEVADTLGVVGPGEVAVVSPKPGFPTQQVVVAVDPVTGTGHRVSGLPPGAFGVTSFAGRITAFERTGNDVPRGPVVYHWSDDGGRTWGSAELPTTELSTFAVVPTGSFRPHEVLESGDGATLAPVVALHRRAYGAPAWDNLTHDGPSTTFAVAPDGSWSAWPCGDDVCLLGDTRGSGAGAPVSSGVYRWGASGLEPTADDRPDVLEQQDRAVVALRFNEEGYTTFVAGPGGSLVASFDDRPGEWSDVPAR